MEKKEKKNKETKNDQTKQSKKKDILKSHAHANASRPIKARVLSYFSYFTKYVTLTSTILHSSDEGSKTPLAKKFTYLYLSHESRKNQERKWK